MSTGTVTTTVWEVFSASIQGANHVRRGRPNQDAVASVPNSGSAEEFVLAVSDGHGSDAYTRSEFGAQIAARVMVELGQELLSSAARGTSHSALKAEAEETMPRRLVRTWRERVAAHAEQHPVESEKAGEPDVTRLYGATMLGAVLGPEFLVLWQLGDGDIVLVTDAGELATPLAPSTPRLGVDTDSLVTPEAWRRMGVHWFPLHANPPALILLTSDGLSNSYASNDGFLKFGSDVLHRIRDGGIGAVRQQLPTWLSRATEFSGDDVTVAGAWRSAAS